MDDVRPLLDQLNSNNIILKEIIDDLQLIIKLIKFENLNSSIINKISDIIIEVNSIFNGNRIIANQMNKIISGFYEQINKKFNDLNNLNMQEIKYDNGSKYFGQVVNGLKEGKGNMIYSNGDRYDGFFKNDFKEGKGILYYNNGNRYEGEFKNGFKEGKGIMYYNNGDRYEGDFKNDLKEGKGIVYFCNGDKMIGEYQKDKSKGTHIIYEKNGNVKKKTF